MSTKTKLGKTHTAPETRNVALVLPSPWPHAQDDRGSWSQEIHGGKTIFCYQINWFIPEQINQFDVPTNRPIN
jgi:hypothetical protein